MNKTTPDKQANLPFKVNQVVYLENRSSRLYGEVIQLIPLRQICWFRPLCLVISPAEEILFSSQIPSLQVSQGQKKHKSKPMRENKESSIIKGDLSNDDEGTCPVHLIDLQCGSDLLWPMNLFKPALDIEVINCLAKLSPLGTVFTDDLADCRRHYLNKFVQQFWLINQDKF